MTNRPNGTARRRVLTAMAGLLAVAASFAAAPAPARAADQEVLVFAAASLKNALDEVIAAYGAQTGTKVTASYAASSALAKQIEQGAPAQLFISADLDWMDYLEQRKLIAEGTRRNLLGNSLVLVAGKDSQQSDVAIGPGFDLAALVGDGRLAVGEVTAVPAGRYAKAALENLGVMGWRRGQARPGGERPRRSGAGRPRRGAARDRLQDRRRLRPEREDRRHLPGRQPPADHLSGGPDHRGRQRLRVGLPGLSEWPGRQGRVREARLHPDRADRSLTPRPVWDFAPDELTAIRLSLKVALWATFGSLPLGLFVAYALARWNFPGKLLLDGLIHLPLVMPPVVTGYLLLLSFGRRGFLGAPLAEYFGIVFSFRWTGAALACAVMAFPLLVRAVRLSFEAVDRRLEEAAGTLGAGRLWVFATVTLPLAMPGVVAGMVLAYAKALGEFGATITFVSNIPGETQTLPSAIYTFTQVPGGETGALRLTLVSIALALAAMIASELLARPVARMVRGV